MSGISGTVGSETAAVGVDTRDVGRCGNKVTGAEAHLVFVAVV